MERRDTKLSFEIKFVLSKDGCIFPSETQGHQPDYVYENCTKKTRDQDVCCIVLAFALQFGKVKSFLIHTIMFSFRRMVVVYGYAQK